MSHLCWTDGDLEMGKNDGVTKEQQMAALKKLIRELGGKSEVANILGLKEGKVVTGKNMKGGGMAGKTKMANKKMMRGGMAKKKMRGGGMAKMAQKKMMRGGMAKKKMMRGGAVKKK